MSGPSQETLRAFATADGAARRDAVAALTAARLERGITQADLAARMGCPVQVVADMDAGASGSTRLWAVQRYARALGGRVTITVEIGAPDPVPDTTLVAHPGVRRVLNTLNTNPLAYRTVDLMAAAAGTSRFHFSRLFHAATGMPPYQYTLHARINHSKHLLTTTNLPIQVIARDVGYRSSAQFIAEFRNKTGTTPFVYRRSVKTGNYPTAGDNR